MNNVTDFANSYLTFTVPNELNTARIQLDARCVLTDNRAGTMEEFFLISPCQGERMYETSNHFLTPNYEFKGIWSRTEYVLIRTFAEHDPQRANEWDAGEIATRFAEVKIDVRALPDAQALTTEAEITRATLENRALVAHTHLNSPDRQYSAVLEYPIKTMNVVKSTNRFQVDTGPLLFPDFEAAQNSPQRRAIEKFSLAFTVYNTFDGAEFVLWQPTSVGDGTQVRHYSKAVPMPARHEIFSGG